MKITKNLLWLLKRPFRGVISLRKTCDYSELRRNAMISARNKLRDAISNAEQCAAAPVPEDFYPDHRIQREQEILHEIYWEGDWNKDFKLEGGII